MDVSPVKPCYDIFRFENMIASTAPEDEIAKFLALMGKPARIQILMVIREEAACVCHLEAVLGLRQASISQHLMVLRKAGLVSKSRSGRNVFYQLARPELADLLERAATLTGADLQPLKSLSYRPVAGCSCPQCNLGLDAGMTCRPQKSKNP